MKTADSRPSCIDSYCIKFRYFCFTSNPMYRILVNKREEGIKITENCNVQKPKSIVSIV